MIKPVGMSRNSKVINDFILLYLVFISDDQETVEAEGFPNKMYDL